MSTTPRTPVHFPRMKVRGHRNRAKTAERHTTRMVFPNAVLTGIEDGAYTFAVTAPPLEQPAVKLPSYVIVSEETRDGWGRKVASRTAFAVDPPAPKPKPAFQMSMQFQCEPEASDRLRELLTGVSA